MKIIEIKDLGLAAFAKSKGLKLIGFENRIFKFECNDIFSSRVELEVEYGNSCCRTHDMNVMFLRNLITAK